MFWAASYMWDSYGSSTYIRYVTPATYTYDGYNIPGSPWRYFYHSSSYPFYLEMHITDSALSASCNISSYVSFSPY